MSFSNGDPSGNNTTRGLHNKSYPLHVPLKQLLRLFSCCERRFVWSRKPAHIPGGHQGQRELDVGRQAPRGVRQDVEGVRSAPPGEVPSNPRVASSLARCE